MKLLLLTLISTMLLAHSTNIPKVWVSKGFVLHNILIVSDELKTEMFYNGKRMDDRYIVVSCRKPEGFCLVEKDQFEKGIR